MRTDYMDSYYKKTLQQHKEELLEMLLAAGIDHVECGYEGSGDCGNVTTIAATRLKGEEHEAVTLDRELRGEVCEFAWRAAYGTNPGFETNDGGGGIVTIDVRARTCTIEHYYYEIREEHLDPVTL